jgi:hypothetical protein
MSNRPSSPQPAPCRRRTLAGFVAAAAIAALGSAGVASAASPVQPLGTGEASSVPATLLPSVNARRHALGGLIEKKHVHPFAARRLSALLSVPASADLTQWVAPVGDQGAAGSCVTWAIVYGLMGWYENRLGLQTHLLNPMSVYSQAHVNWSTDPVTGYGGGSFPATVLGILQNQGADTMAHYSHNVFDWTDTPNASEQANARNYEIAGFRSLIPNYAISGAQLQNNIQAELAAGRPVAIGLYVRGSSLLSLNKTNYTYNDTTNPRTGAGHEMLAVAYNQNGLWVQNSWGTGWGYNGFAYLTWNVVQQDINSAYVITGLAANADPDQTDVSAHLAQGLQATSSTVPVTFTWNIDRVAKGYDVWQKVDGGSWTAIGSSEPMQTATQTTLSLSYGHRYQVVVKGVDYVCDSNRCGWETTGFLYSSTVTPGIYDDSTFSLGTAWSRFPFPNTVGGYIAASTSVGSPMTLTLPSATDIGLVAPTFSNGGSASVTCDGLSNPLSLSFYSASQAPSTIQTWCHFSTAGSHFMKVTVGGNGSGWTPIDAFVYLT